MNGHYSQTTLIICLVASIAAHFVALRMLSKHERLPLIVFSASYFFTSVIGATIMGIRGVGYLEWVSYGISTIHVRQLGDGNYWLLVYAPLVIPPLIVSQLARPGRMRSLKLAPIIADDRCYPLAYAVVLTGATLFCVYSLLKGGFNVSLNSWSRLSGEFVDLMVLRSEIMNGLGFLFFGMVYVGLPALSFAALYQWQRYRTVTWALFFGVTFLVTCWLGLATIQKSILLVYVMAIGYAMLELRLATYKHMAIVGVCGCILLTVMQQFFVADWSFANSLIHVTHRMAMSFPYYANVYPEVIPYGGLDYGLWLFNIGTQPTDNLEVFDIMYPDLTFATGYAAAPAHLRLYSQCGMPGALGSLVVIGLGISLVTQLSRRVNGPIAFAIYIQALVAIYYSTQVSLVDLYSTAYGLPWCTFTLFPLWIWASAVGVRASRAKRNASPAPLNLALVDNQGD